MDAELDRALVRERFGRRDRRGLVRCAGGGPGLRRAPRPRVGAEERVPEDLLHALRPGAVVRIGREEDEPPGADGLVGDGSRPAQFVLAAREARDEEVLRAECGVADGRGSVDDRHDVVVVVERPVVESDAGGERARLVDGDAEEASRHVRVGRAQARGGQPEARCELGPAPDPDEAPTLIDPGAQGVLARLAEVQRRHLGVAVRGDEDVDIVEAAGGDLGRRDVLERHVPLLVEEPAQPAGGLAGCRRARGLEDADPGEVGRERRRGRCGKGRLESRRRGHGRAGVAARDVEEERLTPRAHVVEEVDRRIGRLVQHCLHPVFLALRERDPVRAGG